MIGAWSGKDTKLILKMVEGTLTRSTADEDMRPADTLGLYTVEEQTGIMDKEMSRKMMLAKLWKYLNRWHATLNKWKKKRAKELTVGIKEGKLSNWIMIPGEIGEFLTANGKEHKITPPTFFFKWNMREEQAKEGVVEQVITITNIPTTLDLERYIPKVPLPRNSHSNRWAMAEMLLKSTYINEKNDTVRSPFTRVEAKAR